IRPRVHTPDLLSAAALRSLALVVERRHRCSVITDRLLVEAIREAALDIEDTFGKEAPVYVRKLNEALLAIDAQASPLLSLATVDRIEVLEDLRVFINRIFAIVFLILVCLKFLARSYGDIPILVSAEALLVAQFLIFYATIRAEHFW